MSRGHLGGSEIGDFGGLVGAEGEPQRLWRRGLWGPGGAVGSTGAGAEARAELKARAK